MPSPTQPPAGYLAREQELVARLALLRDPQERLSWIVSAAARRPPLPADQRSEAHLVKGCASRLWLVTDLVEGRCRFKCDSDSALLKAFTGLVAELYNGLPPAEVREHEPAWLGQLGLLSLLTENRRKTVLRFREALRAFAVACHP